MRKKVLITGGAGFIGSHLTDSLISQAHDVVIFDNLEKQVHPNSQIPSYLNPKATFIEGDVRDIDGLKKAIADIDVVFNFASAVGLGQSMYEISRYVSTNSLGTANLLDVLVNHDHDVKKVIVASSMSKYGEGAYICEDHGEVHPNIRPHSQLLKGDFDVRCPHCNLGLKPIPTREDKALLSSNLYSLTKKHQEEMTMSICGTYGIPSTALRFFNVFGPRQSLNNPYTGVAAMFLSRIKNDNPPVIFEDGLQTRDFVSVHDIVSANVLSMNSSSANNQVFNVGSGIPLQIKEVAETLIKVNGSRLTPMITHKARKNDVRHCYADISKIRSLLGFEPKISFEHGIKELISWSRDEKAIDKIDEANKLMEKKGLI